MRLVTFVSAKGPEPGLLRHRLVVPLAAARSHAGLGPGPATVLELIEAGPDAWSEARAADAALDPGTARDLAVGSGRLMAPIPRPRKNVMCIGRNFGEHASEQGAEAPTVPVFFTKAPTTVVGQDDEVPYPPGVRELDYEGELALVIGAPGRDIAPERAIDHVFAYTIVNDVTARDAQRRHLQWFKGKSFDGTCPMGPALVTPDEVGDLRPLRVRTFVNGELRQDQPVSDMIFDVATIISELSSGMMLEAGDIISTGTPSGVGAPSRRFLLPGDRMEVHVEPLGVLRSVIGPKRPVLDSTVRDVVVPAP